MQEPVWSVIGWSFRSSTFISSIELNSCVLAVAKKQAGWFETGYISS